VVKKIAIISAVVSIIAVIFWCFRAVEDKTQNRVAQPKLTQGRIVKELERVLLPEPVTPADRKRAQVSILSVNSTESEIFCAIATDVRPLLQAERNMFAYGAQCSVMRNDDGLVLSIGGHKAANSLKVDFKNKTVEIRPHDEKLEMSLFENPPDASGNSTIMFGRPFTGSGWCISINLRNAQSKQREHFEIPYNHPEIDGHCFHSDNYPIAAMSKVSGTPLETKGILLLDMIHKKILADIALPDATRTSGPLYALDMKKNILVGVGSDLNWIVVFDLEKAIAQINSEKN
jgi:hypothetical protein